MFELLFQLSFALKGSCGEYFDWEPFFTDLKWYIRTEDMGLEPAIGSKKWKQPSVCVKQCGINPATLSLWDPDNPWHCQHATGSCDCPCPHPYNDETQEGICREGDCCCLPFTRCKLKHTPVDIHSSLTKLLFEGVDKRENEALYYLLFGDRNSRYQGEWKRIADLLKEEKLTMELIVTMIKSIFKTWFGITLSTTIVRRGGPATQCRTGV